MQLHQALDHMFLRPLRQARRERAAPVELQRVRARHLDGTAYPPAAPRGIVERIDAIAVIDQHARAALQAARPLRLAHGLHEQLLEL